MIYVPSRQRAHLLAKTAPTWVATGLPVRIMVAREEAVEYAETLMDLGLGDHVSILIEPSFVKCIGGARQAMLLHSASLAHRFHIQVDDDMKVTPNLGLLMDALNKNPDASGCGAWQSYYGLGMGKEGPDVFRNYSSMGLQVKAYRNDVLLEAGGFDPSMALAEDVDAVMRVARATGQHPLIHRQVVATSVNARGGAGGCASRGGHSSHAESTVDVLNGRYGPGTASVRAHKRTGQPRDTIWMARFWKDIEERAHARNA